MKNYMLRYAKKHGIDVTAEEIEAYIHSQRRRWKEALRDFTFQDWIMK